MHYTASYTVHQLTVELVKSKVIMLGIQSVSQIQSDYNICSTISETNDICVTKIEGYFTFTLNESLIPIS